VAVNCTVLRVTGSMTWSSTAPNIASISSGGWRQRPNVQIIGEVADGLEAVQKAELLEQDLVLLDIGLPTLNRIEAARQIRKLAPVPK
jgi:CheY-like chemotaxis protein